MITTNWRKHFAVSLCYSVVLATLSACNLTTANTKTTHVAPNPAPTVNPPPKALLQQANSKAAKSMGDANHSKRITLEKIMSDPDWIGRRPEAAKWSLDNQAIYFAQKRQGSVVRDQFAIELGANNILQPLKYSEYFRADWRNRVVNQGKSNAAWLFNGDIYVQPLSQNKPTGEVKQLTRGIGGIKTIQFLRDGLLAYRIEDRYYTLDLNSGATSLLADWRFETRPLAVSPPKDYVATEQQKLIKYVQQRRNARNQKKVFKQEVANHINAAPEAFYLPKGFETEQVSLSPNGKHLILMIKKQGEKRESTDIMPHYIQEDGRIAAISARRRVADAKPVEHQLWLLDVTRGHAKHLMFNQLPGFNDDVLADVKKENAARMGSEYTVNRLPRAIHLQMNWGSNAPEIQWHGSGEQVAVMLEAWDNKDRWLVTVDFEQAKLITQHRLHDDAWIAYRFNEFGWLNHSNTLFFVSEEQGYANLYTKSLTDKTHQALSVGKFEVSNLQLTEDDQFLYFQANQPHPGVYEVFRVNTVTKAMERLTQLNGNTHFELSPDESQLLLTHSKLTMPPELYLQSAQPNAEAQRLTHTVSDEYLALPWTTPDLVPVPSSHTEQPIYARVYKAAKGQGAKAQGDGDEKRRAVIFNHGAGYLQNAHAGWSVYFREFMFHSMLAQQGYVVMDMDYRASQGYGRDWRTAIYRQMGKPEIEDLQDGVNWLVANANVDKNRIGTYGGSYGGFMTFMALFTKPELFQAGAALRPVTDWAHYNESYTANILNTPDVDPIAYERSSPIYFAEGLQKPLLINAPMVDDNVFFVDVVRLVQRLIELEKQNFETAIYPVEPHSFKQPSSWLDEYRRIYKLFETHL